MNNSDDIIERILNKTIIIHDKNGIIPHIKYIKSIAFYLSILKYDKYFLPDLLAGYRWAEEKEDFVEWIEYYYNDILRSLIIKNFQVSIFNQHNTYLLRKREKEIQSSIEAIVKEIRKHLRSEEYINISVSTPAKVISLSVRGELLLNSLIKYLESQEESIMPIINSCIYMQSNKILPSLSVASDNVPFTYKQQILWAIDEKAISRILFAKGYHEIKDRPIIFLAGPNFSALKWHKEAIRFILGFDDDIVIASPKRVLTDVGTESQYRFFRQRAWERYYMDKASKQGCILFWLPGPEFLQEGVHYGATTRFELGEWMTRYNMDNSLAIEFGSDGNFPTLHTVKYDMECAMPDKELYDDLHRLCRKAVRAANDKFKSTNV